MLHQRNSRPQNLHWKRIGRLLAQHQCHSHATTTQHNTGVEVLHRLRLGWRQDYTSQYYWIPVLTTQQPTSLHQQNSSCSYFVERWSRTHGVILRDGRGATSTRTDRKVQTGVGLTTFNYDHKKTITLLTDSTSATSLAGRIGVNCRSRHISLKPLLTWCFQRNTLEKHNRQTPKINFSH